MASLSKSRRVVQGTATCQWQVPKSRFNAPRQVQFPTFCRLAHFHDLGYPPQLPPSCGDNPGQRDVAVHEVYDMKQLNSLPGLLHGVANYEILACTFACSCLSYLCSCLSCLSSCLSVLRIAAEIVRLWVPFPSFPLPLP
jgi:hypothetical protein